MKKVYEKPALYIERFMLTQSIASGCGDNSDYGMPTQNSKEVCGWDMWGFEIFYDPNICDNAADAFDFICYNAPAPGQVIFAAS